MPRPTSSSSVRRGGTSFGSFGALAQAWRERKAEKADALAREVINAAAGAENALINELDSIDFLHSGLSKDDLAYSSNPNRTMGDLEYAKCLLINSLKSSASTTRADLRPIDEQLLLLARKFKYAVEKGDRNAAFAAKAAMAMGVDKVRSRVPETQPDKLDDYIERSADYLAHWVTEVDLSSAVDQTERQTEIFQAKLEEAQAKLTALNKNLELRISEDSDFAAAFGQVSRDEIPEDRRDWTEQQTDAHRLLVDINFCQDTVNAARQDLDSKESELRISRQRVEDLKGMLAIEPSQDINNLLNQYNDIMNAWFKELEAIDVSIAEFEKQRQNFKGIREQLEHGEGATAMRNRAEEQARKIQKDIQRRQQEDLKMHQKDHGSNYDLAGIPDPERHQQRLDELDREREAQEQKEREQEREDHRQRILE